MRSRLTGRETVRFFADLYHLDARACTRDALRWFDASLMGRPMLDWPAGDRTKFERLAALWPEFDVLVIYGAGQTGDAEFDAEWMERFQRKLEGRGLLAIAPPVEPWSWICDITILLREDQAICYSDVTEALLAATPAETGSLVDEQKRAEPNDDELF